METNTLNTGYVLFSHVNNFFTGDVIGGFVVGILTGLAVTYLTNKFPNQYKNFVGKISRKWATRNENYGKNGRKELKVTQSPIPFTIITLWGKRFFREFLVSLHFYSPYIALMGNTKLTKL